MADASVLFRVTQLGQTFGVLVTIVTKQFVTFANDSLSAQVRTTTTVVDLVCVVFPRIVNSGSLDRLPDTICIGVALRVALQNMITLAPDTASRKAFEVVVAEIVLCFVSVQAGPRIHTRVS